MDEIEKIDFLDEQDIEDIREMYDEYMINQIDIKNVKAIYYYLINQGIIYVKDIFISNMELFLLNNYEFIEKFELLKEEIGENYANEIEEDFSLFEKMY